MHKVLKICLICFGTIALIGIILLVYIGFRYGIRTYKISDKLFLNESYSIIYDDISIDTAASSIEIKEADDEKIKLVIYGDDDKITVDKTDKTLSVKTNEEKCKFFCFNVMMPKVELYLPKNYHNNIHINNKYGNVNIDAFSKMNLDIKVNAGDAFIKEIKSITAKLNYGDIKIGKINEYLDINNDCGDIKIDSVNIEKDSYIKNDLGSIKVGSTNEIYIEAKTDLGDVQINHNYINADITLEIKNNCGDIKVNN